MTSWQDRMAELGIDLGRARFEQRVEDETCVLRSFGSAVGVNPSEADYKERLAQIDRQSATELDFEFESVRRFQRRKQGALGSRLLTRDNAHIRRLPRLLEKRGTPLGTALADFHMAEKHLSLPQIDDEIRKGNRVIGIFLMPSGRGYEKHAAHILSDLTTHSVRMLSDEGKPRMNIPHGSRLTTFVLRKRR